MKPDLLFFFPGEHPEGAFFGHPGLNNFLYFLYSSIFGVSLFSMRAFSLIISCLFVLSFYCFVSVTSNRRVAFYSSLSLMMLPMFQIQSIMFFNEMGSLMFALVSLALLHQKRLKSYALFGIMAVLFLESAIAFYIAISLISIFHLMKKKNMDYNKQVLGYSLVPSLFLVSFFLCEYITTGEISNHITRHVISNRLDSSVGWPGLMIDVLPRYAITFKENFSPIFLLSCVSLVIYHVLYKRKSWFLISGVKILFLPALFYLLFFTFFSEFQGGRDLYVIFLFLIFYFFQYVDLITSRKLVYALCLLVIAQGSYSRLNSTGRSHFQTSLQEYQREDIYKEFTEKILEKVDDHKCYVSSKFFYNNIYCRNFYGVQEDIEQTKKKSTPFFVLLSKNNLQKVEELKEIAQNNNLVLEKKVVGKLEGQTVVVYLASQDQEQ